MNNFIAACKVAGYLVGSISSMRKAKKLDREGKIVERDNLVNAKVADWAQYMISLTGSTVEVVGEEHIPASGAVVFIGNHQGLFDIPILLGYIRKHKAFISKIEILKVPLLSTWMKFMQCTFLSRKDMRQSVRAMQEAVETVKKGYSLVIFPEGTRSRGGPVTEFKAGSFKLAFKSGVPIVPVTIDGSWRIYEEHQKLSKANVRVTVHPAIPTANLSREEAAEIPAKVQAIVAGALPNQGA